MVEDWEMEDCDIDLVVYYGMLISGQKTISGQTWLNN